MKRTLSFILAMLMVVTIFAAVGMAEDEPETTGEPEAVETAAPAAEEPAAPVEEAPAEPAPASEPVSEPAPISEEPADNGVALAGMPDLSKIPEAGPVMSWVELDCNGGSHLGYTKFYADVKDGELCSKLTPVRDGYKFVGWYESKEKADKREGSAIKDGDKVTPETTLYAGWKELPKPADTTDNYKYGVWLTVVNGDFESNYAGKASVWVEFTEKTRTLPSSGLPKATRSNGEFEGWYTQAPTEELKNGYWSTVTKNGAKIVPGVTEVPQGVQVLYAAFTDKERQEESEKLVTFYLHPNGMGGMTGALECIRKYEKDGVKFTAENAAVDGVNFDYQHTITGDTEEAKWDALKKIWESDTFNGYKFLGWYKADGTLVEGGAGKGIPTVANGEHLYAHWSKDGTPHETIPPSPTPAPTPGPVDHIHIVAPHMTVRQDPSKTDDVTVTAFVTPVGGSYDKITWTIEVPSTFDLENLPNPFKDGKTCTIEGGETKEETSFTAKAEGLTLTITPKQGCTQALYVSAKCDVSGKSYETPAKATVVITHTPDDVGTVTHAATCTAEGEVAILCTECGEVTEAHAIPATGHTYEVEKTGVENGVPVYTKTCVHHDATETFKGGDVNGDGRVSSKDVTQMFRVVSGESTEELDLIVGDVNGDGRISSKDVTMMFCFVSGETDTLG